MKYCIECGNELIQKELENEGIIPFCPICKEFRFPTFNSAISTVLFNPTKDKVLLIQQYGNPYNILVAGYINKGENAKQALLREVQEEVQLNIINYTYNDNIFFDKSNTLIHNYISYVDSEQFHIEEEVDFAKWYTLEEAIKEIKPHSLAKRFFFLALHKTGNSKVLFHYEKERIFINDHDDQLIAEITFPKNKNQYEITHTYVDASLRGLQIASKLVEAAVQYIESNNETIIPICSYAVKWFDKFAKNQ